MQDVLVWPTDLVEDTTVEQFLHLAKIDEVQPSLVRTYKWTAALFINFN